MIEKMLFGDYRVGVWGDHLESLLDKEYFCRGYASAFLTASEVQNDMFPEMAIYSMNVGVTEEVSKALKP